MFKCLHNPFTQKLGLEAQFEIINYESDTKDYSTKNNNIKEGDNYGSWKVEGPGVEMVDLPGDVAPQGFASKSDKEDVTPKLFDISEILEGTSIYYISHEETKLFHPKEVQNMVSAIKI